ncbi:hypothetical protein, partial [Campylobacter upsaliensis]|uniref:hypothetical protein n=1 Tax=Campylobacter upsaliensis TaxID=28080 RepID=UPI002149E72D
RRRSFRFALNLRNPHKKVGGGGGYDNPHFLWYNLLNFTRKYDEKNDFNRRSLRDRKRGACL